MIWQPEFTDKTLSRKPGAVQISENRELLELIKNQHPEILDEYPWVSGWLDSQEKFLVALADKSGIDINKSGLI
ncbi:TPA: hypothetical protein M5920_002714 [Klebsiella pneumoniae]|nr:hypothetical protein [Klebsiella pneumoniae]